MRGDDRRKAFEVLQGRLLEHYAVPARSRFVVLRQPKLRAHVLEVGAGAPAVILHGGDGEAVDWAPLMAVLQDRMHLYAVDRPGFGLTDPFDYRGVPLRAHATAFVTSLLDALGLESATLIGGSLGGFFCLAAALDRPERVRDLVLVGMVVGVSRSMSPMLRLLAGVPGATRLLLKRAETVEGQRAQYRHEFHVDPDTLPELYLRTRAAGVRIPEAARTFEQLLRSLGGLGGMKREAYLGEELRRLQVPTLFLWGDRDDLAPIADGRAVSRQMPRSTFVELEGVGHFPFLEAPQRASAVIADFLGVGAVAAKAQPVAPVLEPGPAAHP